MPFASSDASSGSVRSATTSTLDSTHVYRSQLSSASAALPAHCLTIGKSGLRINSQLFRAAKKNLEFQSVILRVLERHLGILILF
jgi:hypothetical protein